MGYIWSYEAKWGYELERITTAILVAAFMVSGLYFWFIFPLDWQILTSNKAPEGVLVAHHLQSTSEVGEAPYGDHIV